MRQIMNGAASNANYPDNAGIDWHGGPSVLVLAGTFDGATVTLQMSPDGGATWAGVDNGAFTAAAERTISLPQRCKVRLNLASAGGSTDIDAWGF